MKIRCKWAIAVAALVHGVAWSTEQAQQQRHDAAVVVEWNQRLLAVAEAEDGFLTLKGVRTAAMMHLAMHDALNAVHREYASYAFEGNAPDADPVAAASLAAYEIAANQYPQQIAQWTELRGRTAGAPREDAVKLGEAAAAAVLARRKEDKWDQHAAYRFHPVAPGVYAEFREHSGTPAGFVFGAGWATVQPFMLTRPNQFRVEPPPSIASAEYARAFAEVKEVGSFDSRTRTADHTHLAMWWKEFAESSHNRLARKLVTSDRLELRRAARLFALLNMAIFDGYVSVFDSKFFYNHWRPYTAIRWADQDGNAATEADFQWNNLHRHTYASPSYPSAHGTVCSAAMIVMADTFGEKRRFTMETRAVDKAGPMSGKIGMEPPTRSFESFPAAALECSLSRVYLGIHFRYDSLAGNALGSRVGRYAVEHFLKVE
jgi:membrane-associated phospholipid phosphatase